MDDENCDELSRDRAERDPRIGHVDRRVANLAKRQHGMVSASQLEALGVGASRRHRWCRSGRLHRVHRNVYALGWPPRTFTSRCMAAVLAVGRDGMVTGQAAAYLRGHARFAPRIIDVVVPKLRRCRVDGARILWSSIEPDERDAVDGIPTATVARALVDQADHALMTELAAVMHEAEFRECLDVHAARHCNDRRRTRRGAGHRRMCQALDLHQSGSAGMLSALERRALDRLLEGGAPMPEITPLLVIGRRRLRPDFLYRGLMLVIEVDGTPHDRKRTRNDDAIKTELLEAAGYRVLRVGYRTWRRDIDAILREEFGCAVP